MAITFTGVNTGRTYVAGTKVANGNGVYTVQKDGTFRRDSNGGSLVGSSQSSSTVWGTTSTGPLGTGAAGRAAAIVHDNRSMGSGPAAGRVASAPRSGSGPGNSGSVSSPGAPGVTSGPGVRVAATAENRGAFLLGAGIGLSPSDVQATPVTYRGTRLPLDTTSDDVEIWETRYGEPGEWVGGILVMGTDAAKGVYEASTLKGDKVSEDLASAGWAIAEGFVEQRQRIREQERQSTLPKWVTPPNVVPHSPVRYSTGGGF